MQTKLLTPAEVDHLLRYPPGRSERLARRGKISHIKLPDGEVRFRGEQIDELLCGAGRADGEEGDHTDAQ